MPSLDADTVSEMHFGGFERADGRPKTRKEVMAEVVAKSKLHRYYIRACFDCRSLSSGWLMALASWREGKSGW